MNDFADQMRTVAEWVEKGLNRHLTADGLSGVGTPPERLIAAMRHGALNGGKRLRPLLVVQAAEVFGVDRERVLPAALAVEMVHCYSLIHDDLPAMDDDDLRRGQPTVHKAFDEATAILAGDALLTEAFALLAQSGLPAAVIGELATASGVAGMVGGQMRDLEGERAALDEDAIIEMQAMKTGALIRGAVRTGALIGGADDGQLAALTRYGALAGQAFQLADDILDVTSDAARLGKATQKDAGRHKPTLVSRIGLEATERRLGDTIHHAITALSMFGKEADGLRATARFFADRDS